MFSSRAPKNQLHFKSLCITETTKKKKKLQAIILWSFNDPSSQRDCYRAVSLFSVFEHEDMKLPFQEAAVLGKFWLPNQPSRSIQHTVATRGTLESRINTLQLQSTAAPQHKAKRTENVTGYSTEGHRGQWTIWRMGGGRGGRGHTPHTEQTAEIHYVSSWEWTDRTEMM